MDNLETPIFLLFILIVGQKEENKKNVTEYGLLPINLDLQLLQLPKMKLLKLLQP